MRAPVVVNWNIVYMAGLDEGAPSFDCGRSFLGQTEARTALFPFVILEAMITENPPISIRQHTARCNLDIGDLLHLTKTTVASRYFWLSRP